MDDWEELAVLYLDGALSYEAKLAVEEHLRVCPSCAARMETQRQVAGLLETVEYVDPPSDLFGRIQDELLSPAGAPPRRCADEPSVGPRGAGSERGCR